MRGSLSHGAYLPHRRLDRTTIAAVAGAGGGTGTRTVASYDEDTTTLGVEASRRALRGSEAVPGAVWFSTVEPAYVDKTNATAIHAALAGARRIWEDFRESTVVRIQDEHGGWRALCSYGAPSHALN